MGDAFYDELYKDMYKACLAAARTLDHDIKGLSWLGQWKEAERDIRNTDEAMTEAA